MRSCAEMGLKWPPFIRTDKSDFCWLIKSLAYVVFILNFIFRSKLNIFRVRHTV